MCGDDCSRNSLDREGSFQGICASLCTDSIMVRAISRNSDGPDNFAVYNQRDAALDGNCSWQAEDAKAWPPPVTMS